MMQARFKHDSLSAMSTCHALPTMPWLWHKTDFWFKTLIHATCKLRTACARFLNYELEQCRMWVAWVLKLVLLHSPAGQTARDIYNLSHTATKVTGTSTPCPSMDKQQCTESEVTTYRRQHRVGQGRIAWSQSGPCATLSICEPTGMSQTPLIFNIKFCNSCEN